MRIRAAHAADTPAIDAIMAPAIAAGQLLPHLTPPPRRHVAESEGRIVGAVSLKAWSGSIIELGGLISVLPGRGVGQALVTAALTDATEDRYAAVVALTSIPTFFERLGFVAHDSAPWRWARQPPLRVPADRLGRGMLLKSTCCAGCPRLSRCTQVLMVLPLDKARIA